MRAFVVGTVLAAVLSMPACVGEPADEGTEDAARGADGELEVFLEDHEEDYQRLSYAWSEAVWASNPRIVEGDSTNNRRAHAGGAGGLPGVRGEHGDHRDGSGLADCGKGRTGRTTRPSAA